MQVTALNGDEVRDALHLKSEMLDLARASYLDPTAIVEREVSVCTRAYFGRSSGGTLLCFYLTAWHDLAVGGQLLPTVYLGMSATTQDTKNTGLVAVLYNEALKEIVAAQNKKSSTFLLWSTTASPTIFLGMTIFLDRVEPRIDGSYSEFGLEAVTAIKKYKGFFSAGEDDHPFVLRRVAERTLYSVEEKSRIEKVKKKKNFTLFDDVKVHEDLSDRLLVIAHVPKDFKPRR